MAISTHPFAQWIKRHISSIAFATGFVWDTLTLTRIDLVYENVVFVSYLTIAFVGILLVHSVETGRWAPSFLSARKGWLPALVQFPLGGLFSGFVIFYTKSASFVTSWPFLAILLLLFFGNELFRRRYERLVFQMSMFYFCLIAYVVLITPVVLGSMGTSTFVLSTLISFLAVALLLQVVMYLFPELYKRSMKGMWFALSGIFCAFHVLYFTNIIPPVPLALTEIGMYHSVVRVDDAYQMTYEAPPEYAFWRSTHHVFHRTKNEPVYCFSAVFAPTAIRTKIFHSWQRKSTDGNWIREERIPFSIVGGRDHGYRGYTFKRAVSPGEWRCVVETENGQTIGVTSVTVVDVETAVPLAEKRK
jgi:hypothetical protein